MADQDKTKHAHEEEIIGKAYDARLMRRLLTYLRPYRLAVVVSVVAILIKAVCDVSGPYLIAVAIDRYMTGHPTSKSQWMMHWLSANPYTGITQIAGIYMGALLISYLCEFTQTYLMQWTGQKIMFDLRRQIFNHLQRMHVAFYDRNPVGRLVTRLTSDVDALNEMFTSGVVAIFEDIFTLAFIVAVMLRMNWWLALLTFAVLPLIFLATMIFRRYVRDSYRRVRIALARINSFTQEHVSGMSLVQLFNRQRRAFKDFEDINRTYLVAFKDSIMAYALYYPAVEILSSSAIAMVLWVGGVGVIRNVVTIGVLVAFIQYALRFFRPIQDLSEKYNILQAAMAASERVFRLLDTKPEIVSPAHPKAGDGSGSVEFRNVWFTYQRLDAETAARVARSTPAELEAMHDIEWILRDVSFRIEPDQTAAIVGHTGAGKTTIVSLMMRFYDVQHGHVLIDGVDARERDLLTLRRHFGVVLQDPFLFSGTIRDNIRLGTEISDQQIEMAAEQVNVHDFICTLPGKYDEELRERGNSLSTGQKQLINFARALAHNPRVLILDEATSSVDTDTEIRVRGALDRMITGRTSVVIAHRLSTVQRADIILVMHKGQLREMGTHQQLLAQRGIYWRLYQLQYKDQELSDLRAGLATTPLAVGTD
ncbi:MAG TPA: ABC transporter ATP-binding protein [Acidobacteriaceae bacterium]|nr:ABC transporter ATP-binding protein [Acidobacteriaceae bacterium]